MSFVEPDGSRLRLMLDADDVVAVSHAKAGAAIAITAADVPTLKSVQMKGTCVAVEAPATEADYEESERFRNGFYRDIEENDGTPRDRLERLSPTGLVAVVVAVQEVFDQTPGPKAGRALSSQ